MTNNFATLPRSSVRGRDEWSLPEPRFWPTSGLPTTRKVARPVNARALSGALRRCSRKLPEDNLRPPIALDSPVALSPVLCCAASELLACRLALTSVCAELHLLSRALGYFGASATVRAKSLPTGGKPGRRN